MAGTQWKEYFDFLSSDSKRNIGLCKLCNRSYKDVHGVYSNFLKHLKRVHSNEYNQSLQNAKRQVVEQNRSIVDDRSPTASSVQINKSGRINISFVQQLIVRCNLPLSLIEHSSFRHFLKECYPKWQPMSTKKIKRSIIPSLRSKVYEMIQETLRQVQYVTLTVDAWCDRRGRAFLGLTGHFLNDRFISHAYLIDFLRIKSPHTSDKIQALTELVLDQFNIKSKVFRIITDNAASMIKAYKFGLTVTDDDSTADQVETNSILNQNDDESNDDFEFDSFHSIDVLPNQFIDEPENSPPLRMSCFAHTLQLSIRDGLRKAAHIPKVLNKCQLLSRFCHKSSKAADILEDLEKNITKSNVTRWNSEFRLVKSILSVNKTDLESIAALMDQPVKFSSNDFILMHELVNILEPFNDITLECQGESAAMVSLIVPSIVHLLCHLRDVKTNISLCGKLVEQLESSIKKRFSGIVKRWNFLDVNDDDPFNDSLYFAAAVLDPMFKFRWIRDLKLSAIDESRLKHNLIQFILGLIDKHHQSSSSVSSLTTISTSTNQLSSSPILPQSKRRKLFDYDDHNGASSGADLDPSIELDVYLNDPMRSSFSEYWARSQLSSLKKLVIRIFSVQASSAPIERVFSQAGLILSDRRTSMTEQLFRDLVFLKINHFLM